MVLVEGAAVKYRSVTGVIDFVTEKSVSILICKGKHKSQDVKIVVYPPQFKYIELLNEK
jgi:hypothetical protein